MAARATVVRSLEKLSSSGKCWHRDLARMWRKVDFPSTVLVVLSCKKEGKNERLKSNTEVNMTWLKHRCRCCTSVRKLILKLVVLLLLG